jgi:hypothetical protein
MASPFELIGPALKFAGKIQTGKNTAGMTKPANNYTPPGNFATSKAPLSAKSARANPEYVKDAVAGPNLVKDLFNDPDKNET